MEEQNGQEQTIIEINEALNSISEAVKEALNKPESPPKKWYQTSVFNSVLSSLIVIIIAGGISLSKGWVGLPSKNEKNIEVLERKVDDVHDELERKIDDYIKEDKTRWVGVNEIVRDVNYNFNVTWGHIIDKPDYVTIKEIDK